MSGGLGSRTTRATSLSPHDIFLLNEWGLQLWRAFGEMVYLVGSVARAEDSWRDVDMRMEAPFDLPNLARRTLSMAVSLWGRQVTALPIDFQFQPPDEFHSFDGEVRNAMGIENRYED